MENDLLKKFIGKNYEKITTRKFNIPGFFFGTFYMFYRKMYLYGILIFIINLIIDILFNNIFVGLLINLLIALFVNKIYVSFAKNKVNKIKNNNKDKNEEEIEKICKEQGGTSRLGILIGFIIGILGYLILCVVFFQMRMYLAIFNYFYNPFTRGINFYKSTTIDEDISDDVEDDYVPGVYNGMLLYDSDVVVKDEFSIEVPSVFTDNEYDYEYNYEYENKEETEEFFKSCRFSMSAVKDFTSSRDLINQMATYFKNENASSVENKTINNISWSIFSIKNDIGKTYYYANTKNNKVYILIYEVQTGSGSKCDEYLEEVINSVKSK